MMTKIKNSKIKNFTISAVEKTGKKNFAIDHSFSIQKNENKGF
jgi:hypothetical protein